MYNHEARYDDALRVIESLSQRFPRNRLLWLEAANTNLRAKRYAAAQTAIEQARSLMAHDSRPRAPGEDARWQQAYDEAMKSRAPAP
jgi:predicted Zn-dependent protease